MRQSALHRRQLRLRPSGQRRQCRQHRVLHPLLLRAAAVDQLHTAAGQQRLPVGIQRLVVQPRCRLLVAQPQHTVRFTGAHLLHQPDVRPVPLVVLQSADGIDQVGLLAVHILAEEPSPLGHRLQQQLAQQLCHRLQQLLAMGREGVVDESGRKAHALTLALLAHGIVDIGAIQRVQRRRQALHIRVPDGAPPHNGGQQRVG